MKVLAVNGSPRKGGNTEVLLRKVLEPLAGEGWETEFVQLGGRKISGCIACYKCFENKDERCAVTSDALNDILEQVLAADALVFGSPTYFTDVSAEMKALLDRTGLVSVANGGLLRGKIGAAVVAVRRGGGTHVFDTINHMFLMSSMIVPGSIYWNLGYGLHKGDVLQDEEGLRNMNHLGRTIAWLGKAVKPHLNDFPDPGPAEG
ncbi:Multimeric flavodoxin WrbA [Desulfonatronum thiosulfatophilum]|uniref:Multimeric flavodoxin WrbA n=1 Tax=Desulfonatronum thiosulfatophilum TaxID=617002 RepID=A0A1G6A9V4_9BACT|nr:flavodoxin family protein [Desulfonatronum thiosulfatophilum]SDB05217.1 Multimeric flavodoxin WrbA [Desulfonatronum thiosulfatophilum]